MLGTRDSFDYAECAQCKALQRRDLTVDMTRYYPSTYYAFSATARGAAMMKIRKVRNWLAMSPVSPIRFIAKRVLAPNGATWLEIPRPTRTTRILDVGCGTGILLRQLAEAGYRNLTGVDPFLPSVVETPASVRMIRSTIEDIDGQFDYIMFHHSLEHIADQQSTIRAVARLLADEGWCLIRVPTVSSYAWEHYREHWFQVDAPRHLVLHSLDSISQLGASVGLAVARLDFDSTESQILWSERYRQGIAMSDAPRTSRAERRAAKTTARRLNAERRGDQVAVYFRKHLATPSV